MKRTTVRFMAAAIVVLAMNGCSRDVPHPPTFEHFLEVDYSSENATDQDFARLKQLHAALVLTRAELQEIRATRDPWLIAGAAIQAASDGNTGIDLLKYALTIEPRSEMIHISLINRYMNQWLNRPADGAEVKELRGAITRFRRIVPDNGISHYLQAWQQLTDGKSLQAVSELASGNKSSRFDSTARERFRAIVAATESVGYTPFAARNYAVGMLNPLSVYHAIHKMCQVFVENPGGENGRRQCLLAGERVEASGRNTLEILVGLSMQATALQGSEDSEARDLLQKINRRRDALSKVTTHATLRDLPEEVWVSYFDLLVDESEEAAVCFANEVFEKHRRIKSPQSTVAGGG